jgi:hypothetical protein
MRRTSALANNRKASRRKTEEEVVQGQGYANSILLHPPRASYTPMNDYRNAHTIHRTSAASIRDVNWNKR